MLEITLKYLGTIMKDDRKFKQDTEEQELDVLTRIKEFLLLHNVFSEDLFYFLEEMIQKPEVQKAFLGVLRAVNPGFYDLFEFDEGESVRVYGLLMGALMSGQSSQDICKTILLYFKENYNKENEGKKLPEAWHETATMK